LPFWKAANERTELIVTGAGKGGRRVTFSTFQLVCHQVILEGGVELWLQEGKEQIEEVDGMRVANDIPALRIQDAQLKYRDRYSSSDPPRKNVRSDPVKSLLVLSF